MKKNINIIHIGIYIYKTVPLCCIAETNTTGFPGGTVFKNSPWDTGLIPGSRRSHMSQGN